MSNKEATSVERVAILSRIERTKAEFISLIGADKNPTPEYWLDTMEQLALLGFELGRKEMLREWEAAIERQRNGPRTL